MVASDAHMFPGFPTPVSTQLFCPKPPTTFPTCFSRGERRKYARKKVCLNRVSNSQPPGHESDTLTTKSNGWGKLSWVETFPYLSILAMSEEQCPSGFRGLFYSEDFTEIFNPLPMTNFEP